MKRCDGCTQSGMAEPVRVQLRDDDGHEIEDKTLCLCPSCTQLLVQGVLALGKAA